MGPGGINHGHSPKSCLLGTPQRAHLGLWRAFLDANQSLGRVKSSDLVQIGRKNASLGVVGALQ